MAKKRKTKRKPIKIKEASDVTYFLKLILLFILGTFWVRLVDVNMGPFSSFSLPIGLVVGVFLASREQQQVDRKIGYAILLGATFISFYLPIGLVL